MRPLTPALSPHQYFLYFSSYFVGRGRRQRNNWPFECMYSPPLAVCVGLRPGVDFEKLTPRFDRQTTRLRVLCQPNCKCNN